MNAKVIEKMYSVIVNFRIFKIDGAVMRIVANDGGYSIIFGYAPEFRVREAFQAAMLSCKEKAGDIVFQNGVAAYSCFTDAATKRDTVLIKIGIAADKKIGVRHIVVKFTFDAGNNIILVPLQILRCAAAAVVKTFGDRCIQFIVMGAKNQVFNATGFSQNTLQPCAAQYSDTGT